MHTDAVFVTIGGEAVMSYIDQILEEEASGKTAELYASNRGADGNLPNYVKAFSHRPEVYAAWQGLRGAIRARMDERSYLLATLAAAKALCSSYCCLAHGSVLLSGVLTEDELTAIAGDHQAAGLPPTDAAIMDLAAAVAIDASSITEEQIEKLRSLGLGEGEICDVIATAAARAFFSKYLDATGTRADAKYAGLPMGLRDRLTVGRPIAGT